MVVDDKGRAFQQLFDKEWQRRFIAILCRSESLAGQSLSLLQSNYFEHQHDRAVAQLLINFLDTYHHLPASADLRVAARKAVKSGDILEEDKAEVLELIDWCYQTEITDASVKASGDSFITFAQQQEMKIAIIKSAGLIQSQEIEECGDEIRSYFDRVAMIGKHTNSLGISFYELPSILMSMSAEEFLPIFSVNSYPQLNQAMGGGFGKGCIYSVLAPPKFGKTTTLINLGSALLWGGANVYHITLEMSEQKTALRYASRMLKNTDWKNVRNSVDELSTRLKHLTMIGGGKLYIKEFATRSLTINALRGHLLFAETQGEKPDVLIVDYADLMKLRGKDKRYEELGVLYGDLRGLGQELGCAVLTATQSNRSGATKYRPSITDVAGSFEKIAEVDGMLAVCRTNSEKIAGLTRVYALATRDAGFNKAIWMKTDFARCSLREMDEVDVPVEFIRKERGKPVSEEEEE